MFEKKKIQIETLSEYLREVRGNLKLSLDEVGKKTSIKPKFLELLESGEFLPLPPDVYVAGFLKQLGTLYSVEPEILISQYKKEKSIQEQLARQEKIGKNWKSRIIKKLVITPKFLSIFAGASFVLVSIMYIIWQVSSINRTPSLDIFEPQDRQVIQGSVVNVRGRTDPGMLVSVNDQNIFVESNGDFKTQLGLTSGTKELVITARNKFDKSISKTLSVTGDNKISNSNQDNRLQLKLEFSADVTLEYSIDDTPSQSVTFHNSDTKLLTGHDKIVISTSDAGATKATLNGQVLGLLGRPGEKLVNIPFFAESGNIK